MFHLGKGFLLVRSSWVSARAESVFLLAEMGHGLHSPWDSPGQDTGAGSLSRLQGDLPNPGNPGLSRCRIVYQLSPQGKPRDILVRNQLLGHPPGRKEKNELACNVLAYLRAVWRMASVSLDLELWWKGQNSLNIRLEAPETSGSHCKVRAAGGLQTHGAPGSRRLWAKDCNRTWGVPLQVRFSGTWNLLKATAYREFK